MSYIFIAEEPCSTMPLPQSHCTNHRNTIITPCMESIPFKNVEFRDGTENGFYPCLHGKGGVCRERMGNVFRWMCFAE